MHTQTKAKPPKTPRAFQIHLARLKEALASLDIAVPAAKLQGLAAAFYGYRTGNALADALASGALTLPQAEIGHGQESLAILHDPVAQRPFGLVAPDRPQDLAGQIVTSPYGNLVTVPAFEAITGNWPGESMAAGRLRRARAAIAAYTGGSGDWAQPEPVIGGLIADLIRYRHDLAESGEIDAEEPEETAADALRDYLRECLGETALAAQPDIRVEIDDLLWDLAWRRDRAPCEAAMQAYSPESFEAEPDYLVGDLITDLLFVVATVDHGSAIEALRAGLRDLAPSARETEPRVTVQMVIGR